MALEKAPKTYAEELDTKEHELLLDAGERERALEAHTEQAAAEAPTLDIQEVRGEVTHVAEQQANPVEQFQAAQETAETPSVPLKPSRDMQATAHNRGLKQIERHLGFGDRTLSHIIHQPVVRAVSEGAGRTISRPSGILGGALTALIGTSIYLYLARHYGFTYNYFVFLLLFAGGFVFGLALEFLVWIATRSRHHG